jgi:hypothetical protein
MKLTNTLLGTNQLGNCAGNLADGGHNLTFGAAGCPNTFTIGDPKLRLLRNNGGLTETLALKAGSAAIDGVPASGAGCPATDQRGVRRPSGPACDIGAYERTPPVAITRAATGITHRTARLHGSATADAGSASIHFQYGTTTAYGSRTPTRTLGGITSRSASAGITGLRPGTRYHFRLVVSSSDGRQVGRDLTFKTAP